MPRRGEQIHGIKPFLERCAGALKRRALHRVNVMATPLAAVGRLFAKAIELAVASALRAIESFTVANAHDMRQASVVVGKSFHKFVDGDGLGQSETPYVFEYRESCYLGQGDNYLTLNPTKAFRLAVSMV